MCVCVCVCVVMRKTLNEALQCSFKALLVEIHGRARQCISFVDPVSVVVTPTDLYNALWPHVRPCN